MDIIWVLIGFFALITLVFVVIAIFLPEWVGITGKRALEIQKHQHSETPEASDKKTEATPKS